MKSIYSFLLFVLIYFPCLAQSTVPKSPFVKLKFGEPILGHNVRVEMGMFGIKKVSINDSIFDNSMVMFFRNSQGQLFGSVNNRLRQSVHENKLIIFMIAGSYNSYRSMSPGGIGFRTSSSRSKNKFFYSSGLTPTKRMTVNNLLMDTRDDQIAFTHISNAKKFRNASFVSYGLGLGLVIYTFVTPTFTGSSGLSTTNNNSRYLILTVGLLSSTITGAILNAVKWSKIRLGVHQYCGYTIFR